MKTLTFYSYKGGVGRSLALVNIATRLSEFGKKVCIIDFDLEAPGLHLKLPVNHSILKSDYKGIVDYVYSFSNNGALEENIKEYTLELSINENSRPITLIPAGNTNSENYWKKLSTINWYDLIYENPNGLAFFLKLKEIIQEKIKPDFALIDSRTGISEMSGISLSLLADQVVIVAANNKENLNGAKKIIASLSNPENSILNKLPKINFVLSRIPFTDRPEDRNKENLLVSRIRREYLSPFVNDINVIHSDRELEEVEKIKIAYEKDENNAQISIDYLKLFEVLTKDDLTENEIRRFKNIRQSERLYFQASNSNNPSIQIELINKAIELNKSNLELYLFRARVYENLKDYSNSLDDLNYILSKNINSINAIYAKIRIFINKKEYQTANELSSIYLENRRSDIQLLTYKIIIYTYLKEYDLAEEICTEIISINPEYSAGYSSRANVKRLKKNFDSALDDIFKALELDSENIQAIGTLAEVYAELGRMNDFYIHFENSVKLNREFMLQVINEEDIYKQIKDDERFLSLLQKYNLYFY